MSLELLKDANDELISELSYKEPNTASFITARNSCSFQAIGSNVYSPNSGVRIIRFNISGEDWVDPSTLRIVFDVVNNEAVTTPPKILYPVNGPHGFFSRGRLLIRGQLPEDISNYNRTHELMNILRNGAAMKDDLMESFLDKYVKGGTLTKDLEGIGPTERETVLFKPIFGILNQPKYICLKYCPIVIEMELDSDSAANVIYPSTTANYKDIYKGAETTKNFQIENCVVRCDIVTIDNELQNKYDDYLTAQGGAINLRYTTYHSQILKILGTSFSVNLSRSLTFLNRVYASFIKQLNTAANPFDFWAKDHNCFYHTLRLENKAVARDTLVPVYKQSLDLVQSAQIQIGSKLIPDYPIQSSSEAYYFLKKSQNLNSFFHKHVHSLNINGREYLDHKFVMCFDCEKINGHTAAFTGMKIKNGEQITLKMLMQSQDTTRNPEDIHLVLEAEQVLEIRGTYVLVKD